MNPQVTSTIENVERFIATVGDAMAIPHEAGEFLHALIHATGAKRGLEIGTGYGYSGLWIASALVGNGGALVTIDHEQRKSAVAHEHFEAAGLGGRVDPRIGTAVDVLRSLEGSFDFVLIDADKENCRQYVELILTKLSDRAVLVTDNTISHESELAEFVGWIRGHDDFYSTGLAIGNGMELSIKRANF